MNRSSYRIVGFALIALFVLASLPAQASVRDNLRTVVGEIQAVDTDAKTLTVDIGLKDVTIAYTDDTKIKGGDLAEGKNVRISTTDRDGKKVAKTIKVKG